MTIKNPNNKHPKKLAVVDLMNGDLQVHTVVSAHWRVKAEAEESRLLLLLPLLLSTRHKFHKG